MPERHDTQHLLDMLHAREEERLQVARDLHDQVIQSLVGCSYMLSDMGATLGDTASAPVGQLQQALRQVQSELRHICAGLRPPAIRRLGLAAVARAWARDVERRAPFRVSFEVDGDDTLLGEDVALCVFRVLQEALANAHKHAQARHVAVSLRIDPGCIALTVRDDGVGFCADRHADELAEGQHFGLIGMRERLEILGGELAIESAPGRGTSVRAIIVWQAQLSRQIGSYEVVYE